MHQRDDDSVVTERPDADAASDVADAATARTDSGPGTDAVRPRRELLAWRNAVFAIFFLSGLSMASWVARLPAVRDFTELSTQGVGLVIMGGSIGAILGLALVSITQNGLNLLGVSPYAFRMIVGAVILVAISVSGDTLGRVIRRIRAPKLAGAVR